MSFAHLLFVTAPKWFRCRLGDIIFFFYVSMDWRAPRSTMGSYTWEIGGEHCKVAGQGPQSESIRHYIDKECLEKIICADWLHWWEQNLSEWVSVSDVFSAQLHLRFEMIPFVSFYTCCVWTQWSLGTMFEFRENDINSWNFHPNFEESALSRQRRRRRWQW